MDEAWTGGSSSDFIMNDHNALSVTTPTNKKAVILWVLFIECVEGTWSLSYNSDTLGSQYWGSSHHIPMQSRTVHVTG